MANLVRTIQEGDSYILPIYITQKDVIVNELNCRAVRISIGDKFVAQWPNGALGVRGDAWLFALTQEMSHALGSGYFRVQAQVQLSENVFLSTEVETIQIKESLPSFDYPWGVGIKEGGEDKIATPQKAEEQGGAGCDCAPIVLRLGCAVAVPPSVGGNYVSYDPQSGKTEKEKEQARENIGAQEKGDYPTREEMNNALSGKQPTGNYATKEELNSGLETKQDKGDYATRTELGNGLSEKQDKGDYPTRTEMDNALATKQPTGDYALKSEIPTKLSQLTGDELHRTLSDEQIQEFMDKLSVNRIAINGDTVTQLDAQGILANAQQYEGQYIEFLSNGDSPHKTAAFGFIVGGNGDNFLLTYNADGTITQWGRDSYEKHLFETRSLINEPIVDMDNLTIDVQGEAPYMASVRDAKNRPENTAVQGIVFVIAYAVDYQMQLYCDIETGKFYRRVVAGTADRHSFSKWDLLNGGGSGDGKIYWNE